jgi:hypothetical protein
LPVHIITPPAAEPISLAELHAKLELDLALRDSELGDIQVAVRQWVEKWLRRALVTQTWELVLESFANEDPLRLPPSPYRYTTPEVFPWWAGLDYLSEPWYLARQRRHIELPFGQLASVASVTYVDQSGVTQTLVAGTDYSVDTVHVPGRIYPAPGKAWPVPRCQWDAVKIQYVVGSAASSVEKPIKQALLMLADKLYEHDGDMRAAMRADGDRMAIEALLQPYKIMRL